jgi:hypothetical protein
MLLSILSQSDHNKQQIRKYLKRKGKTNRPEDRKTEKQRERQRSERQRDRKTEQQKDNMTVGQEG